MRSRPFVKNSIPAGVITQAFTNVTAVAVAHGLGYNPVVQVKDSSGDLVGVDVNHSDVNNFSIAMAVAMTGVIIYS